MDELDLIDDVCARCRHTLHHGTCPSCRWVRPRDEGPHLPHQPDDLPSIHRAR